MSEGRVIGLILVAAIALFVIVVAGLKISADAKTKVRQQEIASLAAELGDAIFKAEEHLHDRQFEKARAALRAIEPRLSVAKKLDLTDKFNDASRRIVAAEREHASRVEQGWTVFEGGFISPEEKEAILAERQRERKEELRLADEERKLAQARLEKERAESQLEEERRRAQEELEAEARRKALEPTSITWSDYVADCGVIAQRDNEARSEVAFKSNYNGKRIRWSGRVVHVDSAMLGSGFAILVKMEPGDESIHSDIVLDVPKTMKSIVMSLEEHSLIDFVGTLNSQGGALSAHGIAVEQLRTK